MNSELIPDFLFCGSTPYRVIGMIDSGFMCIDMLNGSVAHICPASYDDEFLNNKIWIGHRIPNTNSFKVFDRYDGIIYTYYFNDKNIIHREDGPALIKRYAYDNNNPAYEEKTFWLDGQLYRDAMDWFDALTPEQRKKAAFNLDQITK